MNDLLEQIGWDLSICLHRLLFALHELLVHVHEERCIGVMGGDRQMPGNGQCTAVVLA